MNMITVAASQMACSWDLDQNIDKAENIVKKAAAEGAHIILLQELFQSPYFCIEQSPKHYSLAETFSESRIIKHFQALARELKVVLPISWFEKYSQIYFNSIAVIDSDGTILGVYRKSHIPNSVGYQEKTYFTPGDTGFQVWNTKYARIGIGICWDQWFPECARVLALKGAEMLFYPTAIGSEPEYPSMDSAAHWRTAMCGHAAANMMPVITSNRVGLERSTIDKGLSVKFYGTSFITNNLGEVVADAGRDKEAIISHSFDLKEMKETRNMWAVFRDRRPDLYGLLVTHGQE